MEGFANSAKASLMHHDSTSAKSSSRIMNNVQTTSNHQAQDQDHSSYIRIRVLNSTEVYEGNDAILKCEFDRTNSLYEVSAWYRDDGKIYLPLERLVASVRRTLGTGGGGGWSSSFHYGKSHSKL